MANDFLYSLGDNPVGESVRSWVQLLSNLGNKDIGSVNPGLAAQDNQGGQGEQVVPSRGSAYTTPEGTPAFRGRSYTPEEINQLFPQVTGSGPFVPSVDVSALAEKAGPIFNVADIKGGTTVATQQDKAQDQVPSERDQISAYVKTLIEDLNNKPTIDSGLEARAQNAKSSAMEHDAGRIMLNLFGGRPWQSKEAYGNQAYNEAMGISDVNQERQAKKQELDTQQNQANLNKVLALEELLNTKELYPLSKRLQEARVTSEEQAPSIAQATAQAMAEYRAAQTDKLQGDLAVALQKAAILQYNREHPDKPIPLSGNNKAPVFDLGGALNMLMGGGSIPQGQAPTKQDTTDDFITE